MMTASNHDYYLILNVDVNASQEEISRAYKNLARKYHPDKNNQDERSRREAQVIFQRIKTAYDVLGDPHRRIIYNTLGPDGLKIKDWQVDAKRMTAQEIRDEFVRLQKQSLDNQMALVAKPRASFTVALDASDIFAQKSFEDFDDEMLDDDATVYSLPSIEIRSLSANMAVENHLETNHSITLSGNLITKNGNGDGSFGTIYNYKYSPATQYNLLYQIGRGPVLSASVSHQMNDKTSVFCRGMLVFDTYGITPGARITFAHKIRNYLIGKITYKEGINSSVTTSLIYINEKLLFEVTTSYKLSQLHQGVSVDFGYKFNNDDSKLSISLAAGTSDGIAVEYGCETRIFEINVVGAALSFSLQAGITLKLKFNRANQEFNVPIYLSDEVHSAPIFYGTMVPLVIYYVVDQCYLKRYKKLC